MLSITGRRKKLIYMYEKEDARKKVTDIIGKYLPNGNSFRKPIAVLKQSHPSLSDYPIKLRLRNYCVDSANRSKKVKVCAKEFPSAKNTPDLLIKRVVCTGLMNKEQLISNNESGGNRKIKFPFFKDDSQRKRKREGPSIALRFKTGSIFSSKMKKEVKIRALDIPNNKNSFSNLCSSSQFYRIGGGSVFEQKELPLSISASSIKHQVVMPAKVNVNNFDLNNYEEVVSADSKSMYDTSI